MAEAAVAAPPAPPPPPPAPRTAIHVGATGEMTPASGASAASDRGPAPEPPKPKSAKSRMFEELGKKAQPTNAPEPERPGADEPPKSEGGASPEASSSTPVTEGAPTPGKKEKANPWKVIDEYKGRTAKLEAELAEAKKAVIDPKEKETLSAKLAEYEKRNQELEQEIRFTNYSKSREFAEKYQKPYEDAWRKAMDDLGELTIEGPEGVRPIKAEDLLELVNMPLQKAREAANATFGDFADDVMAHRKEIKSLFEQQNKALEDARKNGATRDQQRNEQFKKVMGEIDKQVADSWTASHGELMKDEKNAPFFKPVEGDDEGNKRLEHGYQLAQKAFSMNPKDPRLTPEQRKQAVREHLAVFHRAAAAGRLLYWLQRERDAHTATRKELDKYRGAEPGKGEGDPSATPSGPAKASDSVFGALRKLAH